jgi:hypothetical protein
MQVQTLIFYVQFVVLCGERKRFNVCRYVRLSYISELRPYIYALILITLYIHCNILFFSGAIWSTHSTQKKLFSSLFSGLFLHKKNIWLINLANYYIHTYIVNELLFFFVVLLLLLLLFDIGYNYFQIEIYGTRWLF